MSSMAITGGQTYTIPFDSIDTKYLGEYVDRPTMETKPLWTRKRLDGEAEYCHVQLIVAQNDEDCYSEPSDSYLCHICNIHVPKICYKEHNESVQHETITKIYQKVLEKVSKQMDTNIENDNQKINTNVYYCVPCSKIIKKENKENHESTEYHAKSKKDSIIINEFYKIMKEDKGNDTKILMTERNTGDVKNKYLKTNNNDETTNKNLSSHLEIDQPVTDTLVTPGPSVINIPPLKEVNTFEGYLKAMTKKYNIKANLPIMIGDSVKIESESGVIVVSQEHFHSYKLLKSCIYCQMCKMWISQDTKPHDVTENHVRNILKPINDKFVRTIDIISSHCVPCNDVVLSDSVHHVYSEDHKKIIKDTRVQKSGQTFCEDCTLFIDSYNYAVHLNSKKHLYVLAKQNSLTITEIASVFFCEICNVNVPKNGIKNHITTSTHLVKKTKNVIELNDKENSASDLSVKNTSPAQINDKNTCATKVNDKNTCATKVNDKNIGATKFNDKNTSATKVHDINTDYPPLDIKKNDSGFCDICEVKIPIGGTKIHEQGRAHKNKIIALLEFGLKALQNKLQTDNNSSTSSNDNNNSAATCNSTSNGTVITNEKLDEYYDQLEYANDLNTEVRCKICFVYVPFIERMIIDHMESEPHLKLATEFKMDLLLYDKFLCYTDDAKTKVLCKICYVHVPNNERNIIEHMEGRNHELSETGLLEFHSMKKESDGYVCECCDVHTKNCIGHTDSRSHNLTFTKTQKIDKNEIRKYVYGDEIDDLVSRRYKDLHRNLLKHNGIYKLSDTTYFCGMCQIKLGKTCEIDHVLGERHLLKLGETTRLSSILTI